MPGPSGIILTGAYQPAYGTDTTSYNILVTATATRLGSLITAAGGSGIPLHVDEMGSITNGPTKYRPYNHVFFQLPTTATSTSRVWMTSDNNTTPVAVDGGPGMEMVAGVVYVFENAGFTQLREKTSGAYPVNAGSAFQLVSSGEVPVSVWFAD